MSDNLAEHNIELSFKQICLEHVQFYMNTHLGVPVMGCPTIICSITNELKERGGKQESKESRETPMLIYS